MILVVLTLILILVGMVAYGVGVAKLSKYAFRIGTGVGWAVILFPPYTFYFAFKQLEVDGKELPTALCCFGLVLTVLLALIFWQPLSMTLTGDLESVDEMMSVETVPAEMTGGEAVVEAVAEGDEEVLEEADEELVEEAEEQLEAADDDVEEAQEAFEE